MTDVGRLRARFAYALIAILWANAVCVALVASDSPARQALVFGAIGLASVATGIWALAGTHWLSRQVSAIATMGQVMLLVYAGAGHPYQADLHMYFFAMLAVLSGWLDWRLFIPATVAIALHHAALSILAPLGVFPNGNAWDRVALHAAIVIVQSAALSWLVAWLTDALVASETSRNATTDARRQAEQAWAESSVMEQRGAVERREAILAVADDFERKVAGIATKVIASVQTVHDASQHMEAAADEAAGRVATASLSSQHTSANVVAVTVTTNELAQSIDEIDRQVAEATRIVADTTSEAGAVLATVRALSQKADDVEAIVAVISTIASQTNLLALNAAIEAARFGRAGSGFAVVAQEVKALANQTSDATETIQARIAAIRTSGQDAAKAIDAMHSTIGSLNEVSAALASVVEQQNAATSGIAGNVATAAQETIVVAHQIEIVSRVAEETGAAARSVALSAEELTRRSDELGHEIAQFLARIRAA